MLDLLVSCTPEVEVINKEPLTPPIKLEEFTFETELGPFLDKLLLLYGLLVDCFVSSRVSDPSVSWVTETETGDFLKILPLPAYFYVKALSKLLKFSG